MLIFLNRNANIMIKKEYIDELQDCFTKLPCPSNNRDPFNRFFNEDLGALKSRSK